MNNNTEQKTILLADDDMSIRLVLTEALVDAGYKVEATDNADTLYQWANDGQGDMVITDVMMPGTDGIILTSRLREIRPDLKVIVISAQSTFSTAIKASESGALEYLPKPFDLKDLLNIVGRGVAANDEPDFTKLKDISDTGLIGRSQVMQEVYRTIARLIHTDLTVLITGESGTGKEVIARALHDHSKEDKAPFIGVNMAAIPRELIESELFGHEKGAFTGATNRVLGCFSQAENGTLFLDEIGDMPLEAQTRLLRVLQEGCFTPVGGRKPIQTNLRVVAATHRDLNKMVSEGTFREDLYYRLNVVPVHIPPLRERKDDILDFVTHFCQKGGNSFALPSNVVKCLENYDWPGNIRELENFIKKISILYENTLISEELIKSELFKYSREVYSAPLEVKSSNTTSFTETINEHIENYFSSHDHNMLPSSGLYMRVIQEVERPLIEQTLVVTNGNQIKAAEILGINRNTLRKKIKELSIQVVRK